MGGVWQCLRDALGNLTLLSSWTESVTKIMLNFEQCSPERGLCKHVALKNDDKHLSKKLVSYLTLCQATMCNLIWPRDLVEGKNKYR